MPFRVPSQPTVLPSLAFQLAEMKAKLDASERRVVELEEERHRQHPEGERSQALGREKPLQEAVGGCALFPGLCLVPNALLPFLFLILRVAGRGSLHSHEMRLQCGALFNVVPEAVADLLSDQRTAGSRTAPRERVVAIETGRERGITARGGVKSRLIRILQRLPSSLFGSR